MIYLFFSSCFALSIGCNTNGIITNPKEEDRRVTLLEKDYKVFSDEKGYLTIKILNENILEKLQKTISPVIIININGDVKIAKGVTVIDSKIPIPCDYTFEIDIEKNTVTFDKENLLIFTSIKNYEYSSNPKCQLIQKQETGL
jgi:hypothetical protein